MKEKKVVLLIVEGESEEKALAVLLRRLFALQPSGESIEFQVVHGDITTKGSTNVQNIKARINEKIRAFLGETKFEAKDLLEAVLLVDTDGAYIPDEAITEDAAYQNLFYTDSNILCRDKTAIAARNQQKRKNLDVLVPLDKLNLGKQKIPFSVYYFACNLDYALHGEANLEQRQKRKRAEMFEQEYGEKLSDLLRFFNDSAFAIGTTYEDSWAYVKEGLHSLQRGTNFQVFLSLQAKSFPRDFSKLLADE